ncbi:MAG: nicotinamide-nucleotide adenylyltransferase, partial [Gammaproteobacteria bacterium]|nr:nicotinamide-nucleotide adenylyltransferase [Gammaproteobacteria bacterium]
FFPEWEMVELDSLQGAMSATPAREAYYRGEIQPNFFPQGTIDFLKAFQSTAIYQQLQEKYQQQDSSNLLE